MTSPSASSAVNAAVDHASRIEEYYRFHAKIYDATRWSFLFGRKEIIQKLATLTTPTDVLEVGCGTGQNLIRLSQVFPQAKITGLDVSESMLTIARKNLSFLAGRIVLVHQAYDRPLQEVGQIGNLPLQSKFDLILCSYSLSMMNPGWEQALDAAYHNLREKGLMAVVDFHDSAWPLFKWLMRLHVRLNGHLLPKLQTCFQPLWVERRPAYAGFWQYLLFVGAKR
jgi:S-adenosylmethionine-diacylgycerolhomoserine-N-methlytransferase